MDRAIVDWAKARWPYMIVRKLSTFKGRGTNGDPDRLFVWNGKMILIEMKAPGEVCTPLQLEMHARWRRAGVKVVVVDSVAAGKGVLSMFFDKRRRSFTDAMNVGILFAQ